MESCVLFLVCRTVMKLAVYSSNQAKTIYRLRVMGPKAHGFKKLCSFSFKKGTQTWSITQGRGARTISETLEQWEKEMPLEGALEKRQRLEHVIWTHAGVCKVLSMVDINGRRFSLSQMVQVLNDKNTRDIFRHPKDRDRDITRSNVQALLKRLFPAENDTQHAVQMLEEAKSWPGWKNLRTSAAHSTTEDGTMLLQRVTIVFPMGPYLVSKHGDFVLVDCTFQLTIYEGRLVVGAYVFRALMVSVSQHHEHHHPQVQHLRYRSGRLRTRPPSVSDGR